MNHQITELLNSGKKNFIILNRFPLEGNNSQELFLFVLQLRYLKAIVSLIELFEILVNKILISKVCWSESNYLCNAVFI